MSKLLFSEDYINRRINDIASNILSDYSGKSLVFVALLRGAAPFASKLMFAITKQKADFHPELDYMMVSTYGSERSAGSPEIVTDLAPTTEVTGRTVIVLDDVLDKGITADFVQKHLKKLGAAEVKLAVLVDKQTTRLKPVTASYSCLISPDVWLAGMGMDDPITANEAYRWSDEIYQFDSPE